MGTTELNNYIIHFSYVGIFLWFLIIEQLTPIPEEVSLITLGYICTHNHLNMFIAGTFALTGLLLADNILFYLSFKSQDYTKKLTQGYSVKVLNRLRDRLKNNGTQTLIICALLPKVRFLSPLIAATSGITWKKFFVVNSLTTLAYLTFYISGGILFHHSLARLLLRMESARHLIFIVTMAAILAIVIFCVKKYLIKISSTSR